jgi:hypothetical protein
MGIPTIEYQIATISLATNDEPPPGVSGAWSTRFQLSPNVTRRRRRIPQAFQVAAWREDLAAWEPLKLPRQDALMACTADHTARAVVQSILVRQRPCQSP